MKKQKVERLTGEWERTTYEILKQSDIPITETQNLLKDTYELCTIYHKQENVPKEMIKLFFQVYKLIDSVRYIDRIDMLSSPSDSARLDAIVFIVDAIEYGFYEGKYEDAFPYIQIDDSNGNSHIFNLEEDFLEELIDANR